MYLVMHMLLTQGLSCQISIVIKIHVRRKVCFKHKKVKQKKGVKKRVKKEYKIKYY